jgi:hypothetical protein
MITCAFGSVAEKVLKVSAGGRIFLWSDRGASSTPCPLAPTMIYRLASTSSGAMRQSRRFSDIGRRLCCMGRALRTSGLRFLIAM